MLVELRTYDFAPGAALRYLDLFGTEGLPIITRHLTLCGYWMTEVGPLNRLRHAWVYRDLADRAERRGRLLADPDWSPGFLPRGLALIGRMESQVIAASGLFASPKGDEPVVPQPMEPALGSTGPRDDLVALRWDHEASGETLLAGRVVVGGHVGRTLSLQRVDAADTLETPLDELLRPVAFSPL